MGKNQTPGERLAAFVVATDISAAKAAEAIGVTGAALHKWTHGEGRPRPEMRDRIARWTGGIIPAADWMTDEERAAVEAVEPALSDTLPPTSEVA